MLISDELNLDQSAELRLSAGVPPTSLKVIAPPVASESASKFDKLKRSPSAIVTSTFANEAGTKI